MKNQRNYNEKIARYGCYFCVMLHFFEKTTGLKLNEQDVEELYYKAITTKGYGGRVIMNENCRLNDPAGVSNLAFSFFKQKNRLAQIGAEKDGKRDYWGGLGTDFDFVAEEYATQWGSHFICRDYNPDPSIELGELKKKVFYKVV